MTPIINVAWRCTPAPPDARWPSSTRKCPAAMPISAPIGPPIANPAAPPANLPQIDIPSCLFYLPPRCPKAPNKNTPINHKHAAQAGTQKFHNHAHNTPGAFHINLSAQQNISKPADFSAYQPTSRRVFYISRHSHIAAQQRNHLTATKRHAHFSANTNHHNQREWHMALNYVVTGLVFAFVAAVIVGVL